VRPLRNRGTLVPDRRGAGTLVPDRRGAGNLGSR
jgi:hypothetical protein